MKYLMLYVICVIMLNKYIYVMHILRDCDTHNYFWHTVEPTLVSYRKPFSGVTAISVGIYTKLYFRGFQTDIFGDYDDLRQKKKFTPQRRLYSVRR